MDYTLKHEQMMYELNIKEQDEEIEEETILEYLKNENVFMDFADGLRRIIRKKMPKTCEMDEITYLKDMAKEQNIRFNKNTLKNWFKGTAPKKGDKDRERMFLICFALHLDIQETTEFFQKVYGDRTFNLRNYKEFVYFCCMNNGWTYDQAVKIIDKIAVTKENSDGTIYTRFIHRDAKNLKTEEEILHYIKVNAHNFDLKNTTAKQKLKELVKEVRGRKEETELLKQGNIDTSCSFIAQECHYDPMIWNLFKKIEDEKNTLWESTDKERTTKKSFYSIYTMVDIIYAEDMHKNAHSIVKNSNLSQAVKGRFPDADTFNKKEPTAEELRKMIILLYSYKFWVLKQYGGMDIGFEEYRDGLDDVLYETYLQKLYIGNPFDWIFMYCTLADDSLDVFRSLKGNCR